MWTHLMVLAQDFGDVAVVELRVEESELGPEPNGPWRPLCSFPGRLEDAVPGPVRVPLPGGDPRWGDPRVVWDEETVEKVCAR